MQETYKTLRLILGDQLNAKHSWFKKKDHSILYLIAELPEETNYVTHHIQKLCAFFAAMEAFAKALQTAGHQVLYLTLEQTINYKDLATLLKQVLKDYKCSAIEWQRPDEYRLYQQLQQLSLTAHIQVLEVDTEHFLLDFSHIKKEFKTNKAHRLENFYRRMRTRHSILMHEKKPLGGQWNFDHENRQPLKKTDLSMIPAPLLFSNDVTKILKRVKTFSVKSIGDCQQTLIWPINRRQSLQLLKYFCQHGLKYFGKFQDAMTDASTYSWSLYHCRLSFSLNTKMISPKEVIIQAIHTYEKSEGEVSLAQIEGFIRQILGWREFIRAMYWINMPNYKKLNQLQAYRSLPSWFWHGNTHMRCLQYSIKQSLKYSYAHHIQRLMVTGNFSLLANIDPDQVEQWYLGIYIDAIEWVEMPNTRGMVLFADNGLIASKPYAASGNYINKMSNYCKSCHYNVKLKTGPNACPLNSLYWSFLSRNESSLGKNNRLSFAYKNWQRLPNQEQQTILKQAEYYLTNIESL